MAFYLGQMLLFPREAPKGSLFIQSKRRCLSNNKAMLVPNNLSIMSGFSGLSCVVMLLMGMFEMASNNTVCTRNVKRLYCTYKLNCSMKNLSFGSCVQAGKMVHAR